MPKYLIRGRYTPEGLKGLLREGGSSRRKAIERAFEHAGGRLESLYYAFGEEDFYVIGELPGNVDAASLAITVAATGTSTLQVVVLLEPEEVDEATQKSTAYRAPGQT